MTPQRLATIAGACREFALPGLVVVWLVAFGATSFVKTGASPVVNRVAPSLAANAEVAVTRSAIAPEKPQAVFAAAPLVVAPELAPAVPLGASPELASVNAEVALVDKPASTPVIEPATTGAAAETKQMPSEENQAASEQKPAAPEEKPLVVASVGDPSEIMPPETSSSQIATTSPPTPSAKPAMDTTEILDECYVAEACVDRYLWALYQRTPKEDSVKEQDRQQVTVKRKGKMVTVTRSVTRVVDEDFGWKDPKAADHAGMSMTDYVIGGMDKDFKFRLFHLLLAAEQAGLTPGITSAFRDDYRQSIASGLKAASDRSYHGGSSRGGYGHGLAADIVSVKGDTRAQRLLSSDVLWNWVDKHGKEYGIGRPYHDRDPPHVGPIDGTEYVSRHSGGRRTASAGPRKRAVAASAQPAAAATAKRQSNARSAPPRRGDAT
jgi:D-alanyl-D-alanine carboxypeptidase